MVSVEMCYKEVDTVKIHPCFDQQPLQCSTALGPVERRIDDERPVVIKHHVGISCLERTFRQGHLQAENARQHLLNHTEVPRIPDGHLLACAEYRTTAACSQESQDNLADTRAVRRESTIVVQRACVQQSSRHV